MTDREQVLLGKRIRDLRKAKGYSQEYLAEISGFHYTYIGGLERAQKNVTLANLIKIANALEVGIYDLFEYTKLNFSTDKKTSDIEKILDALIKLPGKDVKKIKDFVYNMFEDKI
ncbi:helix-turn-helix transcriptional regulator [Paenibacillus sp. CGMCC 1.16610]|uniref:Helix-turn-helix domain-containing protein n=1 Tax=Paenibacillus anseongense TaxID=2682845 RepID=A0ABW9ULC4_9BACL|nr:MULTISPECIES: helix-turn-helix transcriptional regulator [Paenibacillus]MBA2939863.1 helix-turn-helix transcriptional regulator [Paenibacillus sp. CGMCC 1.16610]MVQ39523.1 helix-turn-helix domain-containing protein [Paenibacillus anseongense]